MALAVGSSIATKELRLAEARLIWAVLRLTGVGCPPLTPQQQGKTAMGRKFMLMQNEPNFLSLIFLPPFMVCVMPNGTYFYFLPYYVKFFVFQKCKQLNERVYSFISFQSDKIAKKISFKEVDDLGLSL